MAVDIIDVFEVIDINGNHRNRFLIVVAGFK